MHRSWVWMYFQCITSDHPVSKACLRVRVVNSKSSSQFSLRMCFLSMTNRLKLTMHHGQYAHYHAHVLLDKELTLAVVRGWCSCAHLFSRLLYLYLRLQRVLPSLLFQVHKMIAEFRLIPGLNNLFDKLIWRKHSASALVLHGHNQNCDCSPVSNFLSTVLDFDVIT